MFKTIIFDIDGTLLNTEPIFMEAWVAAGAALGYAIPREVLLQTRAVSIPVAMERFHFWCGEDFPYEQARKERVRIAEETILQTAPEQLRMPGAHALLNWLKSKGYALAAATSTGREHTYAHLKQAELLGFFDAIVCGDMVRHGKPAPDIFLEAARLAGTAPRDCLVVGDTPADVRAANAAGMPVVLIPDQVPATEETKALSWKCLQGLDRLLELLQNL